MGSANERRREVVAVLLRHGDSLCLLQRSRFVSSDRGAWHCVTGYLPWNADTLAQARLEIWEETGLRSEELLLERRAGPLLLFDGSNLEWAVHCFLFGSLTKEISLNWEHDNYAWVSVSDLWAWSTVTWLPDVCRSLAIE